MILDQIDLAHLLHLSSSLLREVLHNGQSGSLRLLLAGASSPEPPESLLLALDGLLVLLLLRIAHLHHHLLVLFLGLFTLVLELNQGVGSWDGCLEENEAG